MVGRWGRAVSEIRVRMTTMTSRKYQITSLYHGCTYYVMVTLIATTCVTDIKASTLTPPNVYFACENSNKYATFNCSGDGIYINWLVDGLSIHDTKIQNRNIAAFDGQVVGGYVFSALMVQTTIENNNTIVQCEIIQSLVAVESLPSVMLLLQGKLNSPSNFSGKEYTINGLELTWTAPNSYQITDSPAIFYYTVCTDTAVFGCINITDMSACTQCRKTLVYSSADIARDSSVPFEISIFAVNGAGDGMVARTILERNNKISSYYEGQETMANSQPEALQAVQVFVLFLGLFFLCDHHLI